LRLALAPVLISLVIAGCVDKANPDNVDKRSTERWNYLAAHQADKAYDYLSPGFRSTQTRESYAASMNSRPVQWKGGKFKSKECDAERCKVEIDVTYSVVMPGVGGKPVESTSVQSETWLLVDGEWFFLPK
jgi:hypothetical protein